ncbi:uncharacterized protein Fot_23761 [Forsythia ovata]|uniref:Uncharacterized protein n=1 Tax=Forsythia ovata TaxID=205694 RepID=A0ABD1U4A2_9LAMI
MDFHSMKRKELQSLCKKYSIPANLSNLDMADKLTSISKETEKPLIRGRSCLKGPDGNASKTESDVVENKKVKKVKFSPDHELIEFTRSREVNRRGKRKSMLRDNSLAVENVNSETVIVENVNILGQVTRSRGPKLMDGVNEKKRGRKLAKIDDIKDIIASIDVESEKECEKKVDNPDRVMRSRRQKLVDLLVNENKRGIEVVGNDTVLANVEREESRVVIRRSLRSREVVVGVKENVKEREEVLENKEIVEKNVILEPQIVMRSKRNANKVEDEGAKKYENGGRRCSRKKHNELAPEASKFDSDSATETKTEVEGRLEAEEVLRIEDPVKVQLRRSNRRKHTTDSHEKMGNDEPVAENKDRYQLSTIMETGTTTGVPKEDVKVAHHTGVTRRSRRRTVISQSVVETHKNMDDETIENGELREPIREPCLVEEGPVREENTRRSRRIASKHEPATMMNGLDGKANIPGKNEAMKRKGVCSSGEDVNKTDDDPTKRPLRESMRNANRSEKDTHIAVKGKVTQKRKQPSRAKKPNLVEASLEDVSAIAESFPIDAQLSMQQVVEITTDAALSCTEIAMKITSDVRQTSGGTTHGKKRDSSVEVSAGSFDTKEVNGPELENSKKNSASKNIILQIDNPKSEMEISASKSKVAVDKFPVPLEIEVENSSEDNISNTKEERVASPLFCQAEDFGCINMLGDGEHTSDLNITGNSGFAEVISSTDVFSLVNQSESMTKLQVIEAKVDNSANKTVHQSLNAADHVEHEVDIVQDNLDQDEPEGVNELTSLHSCSSDVDHQRIEKDEENTATKATEVGRLDPCGGNGNKTSIHEKTYAEDPGFSLDPVAETCLETDISSSIHCSDHIEGDANNMKAVRILEDMELPLSDDRICADTDNVVIGEGTFLHEKQNFVEYAKIGGGELSKKYGFIEPCHGEKFDTAIPGNNIIEDPGNLATAGTIFGINNFSPSNRSDVAEEDNDAFGLESASGKMKQSSGELREDQEAYDVTKEDKTFLQEGNRLDLAEIVKDECFKNHRSAREISISDLFDGEESARTISQDADICDGEDSVKEADMLCPIADSSAIASPAMFGYCPDVNIGASSSCSMEASPFGPNSARNSLESIDASVSEEIGGEEIVAVGSVEETWSKQSNANGIEFLQPIIGSQQGESIWHPLPAAVDDDRSCPLTTPLKGRDANIPDGEFKNLFVTHLDAANSIQEKEALSIGSKTAGFATSVHTTISKGNYGILSQVNESPEDDANEPGLLINLFATPVGIANTIQKKEVRSIGSKAAGDTMSLDKTTSKGDDESFNKDHNEIQLQNPFNLPANNANPSEEKHDHDPAEIVDVAISMDISSNKMEFESHFGLSTESMDSEKIDAPVSEDIRGKVIDAGGSGEESWLKQSNANRIETLHPIIGAQQAPATTNEELKSPFATHVCDANDIQENEALSIESKTAGKATSVHRTISKGDYGILSQLNESPEDDANEPGLLKSLFATPVGVVNTIQEKEAWSIGSKAAGGDTMSLDKTTSKGEHEFFSQADESFSKDGNEIVDVAISMDIACNKMGFESYSQMKSRKTEEEEYRPQNEHAGNMVSYNEFNHLFWTPIDSTNCGPPNDTSCHGTEIAGLTMSADKSISKMVSDKNFDRNIQETEGEKESKNENSVQKCVVQRTPSQEVYETSSDGGSEGDQLKLLFATPVESATPCRASGTSERTASAAVSSKKVVGIVIEYENTNTLQDDIDFVCRESSNKAGSVEVVNTFTKTALSDVKSVVCDASEEQSTAVHVENPCECIKETQNLNGNNDQEVILSSGHLFLDKETTDHGSLRDLTEVGGCQDMLLHIENHSDKSGNKIESEDLPKSEERTSQICEVALAECEYNFEKHYAQEDSQSSKVNYGDGIFLTSLDTYGASLYLDEVEVGDLDGGNDVETNEGVPCSLFSEPFHEDNEVTKEKDVISTRQSNGSYSVKAWDKADENLEVSLKVSKELNADIEMAMEQSPVFHELNDGSNNYEIQSISEEAKETHNTFQNMDNIDADYGAESRMFSYLGMRVPLEENKEVENSEADALNLNLIRDHLKDGEEVEQNSTAMLIKQQFAMPEHQLEDKVEFSSNSLAVPGLPVSRCHETLKESDVADTIKAYIDSESTISVGIDNSTDVLERIDNENATLVKLQAQFGLKPVNADDENDEHTIENKNKKVEEVMQLVVTARESKEAVRSLAYADLAIDGGYAANNALLSLKKSDSSRRDNHEDSHSSGSKNFCSTAKNARTILIHGTPNKALMRGNMKENAPDSKRENIGNLTTARPARRRALQDLQWN